MNPVYLDTARLLIQVAPLVFADDTFALKGGSAINLFVRDMPRSPPGWLLLQPSDHFTGSHTRCCRCKPPRPCSPSAQTP
jgi:hypothetical protein